MQHTSEPWRIVPDGPQLGDIWLLAIHRVQRGLNAVNWYADLEVETSGTQGHGLL